MEVSVTVLFCDWAGSTQIGEQLDPESLRRVQSEWFAPARAGSRATLSVSAEPAAEVRRS